MYGLDDDALDLVTVSDTQDMFFSIKLIPYDQSQYRNLHCILVL